MIFTKIKNSYSRLHHALEHSFRMRISALVMISLVGVSLMVVLFSSMILISMVVDNAKMLAYRQQKSIAVAVEQEIDSIYQLGHLATDNKILLEDLVNERDAVQNYAVLENNVYMEMLNTLKLNQNIAQMTVLKYMDNTIKVVDVPWQSPAKRKVLYNEILTDFNSSKQTDYENMYFSIGKSFYNIDEYALNLYFPIYDPLILYKEVGLLCISIDESVLYQFHSEGLLENTFLVTGDGTIVSKKDKDYIGSKYSLSFIEEEYDGIKRTNGEFTVWTHIYTCNWYVIATTTIFDLVSDTIWPFVIMLIVVLIFCCVVAVICYGIMHNTLLPLEELKSTMNSVALGDMNIRMDVKYRDDEFNDMAWSFNKMVKDVDKLMRRIADEEAQMKQIELNALQSQIKPHFLYNALECIHWQSLMEGDKKSSRLVMALSKYYRLCLSKGQDIVTLDQEISHIESYLLIENARYSDILELEVSVDEAFMQVAIPKMTLQPLVENSIYHGIKLLEGKEGKICISAVEDEEDIILQIDDNGLGLTREEVEKINETISIYDEQYGYGVRNVNQRLEILFGAEYGLHYVYKPTGGAHVQIRIPNETMTKEKNDV